MKGIKNKDFAFVYSELRHAIEQVENLRTQAEDYKASRSEKWAESTEGEVYEGKIEQLEDVVCTLNDAADELRDFIEGA